MIEAYKDPDKLIPANIPHAGTTLNSATFIPGYNAANIIISCDINIGLGNIVHRTTDSQVSEKPNVISCWPIDEQTINNIVLPIK